MSMAAMALLCEDEDAGLSLATISFRSESMSMASMALLYEDEDAGL